MGFKKGDRVIHNEFGIGTCMNNSHSVRFDTYNAGLHDLRGLCDKGYGWHCSETCLESVKTIIEEKLVDSGHDQVWACNHCKYHTKCSDGPHIRSCPARGGQYYAPDEEVEKVTSKVEEKITRHPRYIEIIRDGGNDSDERCDISASIGQVFQVTDAVKSKFRGETLLCKNRKGKTAAVRWDDNYLKLISQSEYDKANADERLKRRSELTKKAEELGYLPGATAKHLTSGEWLKITRPNFDYYDKSDSLYAKADGYTVRIYKQGDWAELKHGVKLVVKDNEPKLLKGSIYRISYGGDEWLLEFARYRNEKTKEICGNCMSYSGHLYMDEDPDENGWGTLDKDTTIRPATIEEMKWFNYCKKGNKFVKKEDVPGLGVAEKPEEDELRETKTIEVTMSKFREGREVWLRKDSQYWGKPNQGNGSRGIVSSYCPGSISVAWDNGDHNGYYERDLQLEDYHSKDGHYERYGRGDRVTIADIEYRVHGGENRYFLDADMHNNDEVFKRLEIEDKKQFVTSVTGRVPRSGEFPEVVNLRDLNKVIRALKEEDERIRRRGPRSFDPRLRISSHEIGMREHMESMRRMRSHTFFSPPSHPRFTSVFDDMGSGGLNGSVSIKEVKAEEDERGILITASQKKIKKKVPFKVETIDDDEIVEI